MISSDSDRTGRNTLWYIEQELGVYHEVRRFRAYEKGNAEEAESIVARYLPKDPSTLLSFSVISTVNLTVLS